MSAAADHLYEAAAALQKKRDVDRLAKKQRGKFASFFRSQKRQVLDALGEYQFLFSESFAVFREAQEFTTDNWRRIWDEIADATTDDLQRLITQAESAALVKGAGAAQALLEVDYAFDLSNPRAVEWFMQHGGSVQYIKDIQATTGDQIKTIIAKSLDERWGYQNTATAISETFDGFSRDRARLIAVNESAQAYEAGSFMLEQGLADQGIELEKSWQNSGDGRVSAGCLENSAAGWIPLNQPFPSGHQYPTRFPGCRCWHIVRRINS